LQQTTPGGGVERRLFASDGSRWRQAAARGVSHPITSCCDVPIAEPNAGARSADCFGWDLWSGLQELCMSRSLTFLGIAGSLRRESYNRAALRAAARLVPRGVTLDTFDIASIPLFNQDTERTPPQALTDLKRAIRAADAIVFATPEYNYSIPGVLKNAIDCASRPYGDNAWKGKPVAVMGASIGAFGAVRAQLHLRQTFVFLEMHPVNQPEVAIGNAEKAFGKDGELVDAKARKLMAGLLQALADLTLRMTPGDARRAESSAERGPAAVVAD
jgi:chromate reductase